MEPISGKAGGAARVRLAVQNTGWLPTNVTKVAGDKKLCRGVVAEIARGDEPASTLGSAEPEWLVSGKVRQEAGQLVGWSHVSSSGFGWQMNGTEDMAVFEWIVAPGTYTLEARHERAGVVRHEVTV